MFGGLFAMLGLSYLVYLRAKANQRRKWLWIFLLWLMVCAIGVVCGYVALWVMYLQGAAFASEYEAAKSILIPTGIGMTVGAVLCLWLVGRKTTISVSP